MLRLRTTDATKEILRWIDCAHHKRAQHNLFAATGTGGESVIADFDFSLDEREVPRNTERSVVTRNGMQMTAVSVSRLTQSRCYLSFYFMNLFF